MKIETTIMDDRLGSIYPLPSYATPGSAGIDLRAMLREPLTLKPGDTELVSSGIAIHIKEPCVGGFIIPRSGMGHKHGIVLGNSTGLIDSDYTGIVFISLLNRSKLPYTINVGDRIAQLVFLPIVKAELDIVNIFNETSRGSGGFGSTGNS